MHRSASTSSDVTASDLREWHVDRTNWTLCKVGVIVSWGIDFFITTTVAIVLAGSILSPKGPSVGTTYAFSLFIFFFVGLSATFIVYNWTGHTTCLNTASMIVLAQLLCVVYVASFFLTGSQVPPALDFADDPILWVQGNGCVFLTFCLVFLPIFFVQLVLATMYAKLPTVVDVDSVEKPPKTTVCVDHPGFHYPYF